MKINQLINLFDTNKILNKNKINNILFDNDVVNNYRFIQKTNSIEKLIEITDFNYYMLNFSIESYDNYTQELKHKNRTISYMKNKNFSQEMVNFYTNVYFDTNMLSIEDDSSDYGDFEIVDSKDFDFGKYKQKRAEADAYYKKIDDEERAKRELYYRKEGESDKEWEKRFFEHFAKGVRDSWEKSKKDFKESMDKAAKESNEKLKEKLSDIAEKYRKPDTEYGAGINPLEHKKGEGKLKFILKSIINGIIKFVNFIVSLLKYCTTILFALIRRLVLFVKKKLFTNVELIKKVCEKMRNDQGFVNMVNNTTLVTTCFFPEFFNVFLRASSDFVNFLAELTYLVDKSTVKTDFEKIKPLNQVEQDDKELEKVIFESVPLKFAQEVQKFARCGDSGTLYVKGGSEEDKQRSKSVAEDLAKKKTLLVAASDMYRQKITNVRTGDSEITNQMWLNYCLNAIENTSGLNELTKSLSNINKETLNSIKIFKKLNNEYNLILSGKKSISIEKRPGDTEQIKIGDSSQYESKYQNLWNKVVVDHCKKQIVITRQLTNLMKFSSNFATSIGKYCVMGYNNVCIEASAFASKFKKYVA